MLYPWWPIKILPLFILLFPTTLWAANLSVDIGKNSTSIAIGRDFSFGYGLIGISARFITDEPWSYIPTRDSLDGLCNDFQSESTPDRYCETKGRFYDGDEWEVFFRLGYKLPPIPRVYIDTGMGISKVKVTELYIFCNDISGEPRSCSKAGEFITWGHVDEDYYPNFLGGLTFEMTQHLLINIDYHSRKGLISGFMWRF